MKTDEEDAMINFSQYSEDEKNALIDFLYQKDIEYQNYNNYTKCRKFMYTIERCIHVLTTYLSYLSFACIILITFMNSLKLQNNFNYAINITISTALWVSIIYFILNTIRFYSYASKPSNNYYSSIIFSKFTSLPNWVVFEFFVHCIIIISIVISLETFTDGCLKKMEDCQHLWKLWRLIFFNQN